MDPRVDLTEDRLFRAKREISNTQKVSLSNKNGIVRLTHRLKEKHDIIDKYFNPDKKRYIEMLNHNCDRCGDSILNPRKTLCERCDKEIGVRLDLVDLVLR